MQLRYGGYSFDDNEVSFQISRRRVYQQGRLVFMRHNWAISGWKTGADAADLTAKLSAMESACLTDGGDLLFYDNNGAPTSHGLFSSGAINGVQVIQPVHYPGANPGIWGMGTEYVNKRSYRVVFQADYPGADNVIDYQESITKIGTGGPKFIWQESLTSDPQLQRPKAFTKCMLIQQGHAIGLLSRPAPSSPLYGDPFFQHDKSMVRVETPRNQGLNFSTHWSIHWRYVFESGSPL